MPSSAAPIVRRRNVRTSPMWYLFLLPTILGIVLFMAYPILEAFRLSFFNSNGTIEKWNGLANYRYIIRDPIFRKTIFNSFFITFFQLLIAIPVSFVISVLINSLNRGKNVLKSLFFIPYVTPAVAAGTLFLFVLHPEGLLNQLLGLFGIDPVAWLQTSLGARFGAVLMGVWKTMGFNIIIFLSYLQTISPEYYEAAQLDGCTSFQLHRYITLPQMRGAFSFLFVMGWIDGLQRFSDVYVLGGQNGSPARSLLTIVGYIYELGFGRYEFGVAAAAAFVLFAMIMALTLVNMRMTRMDV